METVDEVRSPVSVDIWRDHVLKAGEFSGPAVEYCRQNNLNPTTFYSYKRRFVLASKAPSRKKFVRVVSEPSKLKPSVRSLPDPRWLAEFVLGVLKS